MIPDEVVMPHQEVALDSRSSLSLQSTLHVANVRKLLNNQPACTAIGFSNTTQRSIRSSCLYWRVIAATVVFRAISRSAKVIGEEIPYYITVNGVAAGLCIIGIDVFALRWNCDIGLWLI